MKKIALMFFLVLSFNTFAQKTQIALLKYRGGGDWYSNPTSLPNLVKFCNQSIMTDINTDIATVDAASPEIFNYPFVHATGHGNIVFDDSEVENIRNYLLAGGFNLLKHLCHLKFYLNRFHVLQGFLILLVQRLPS